MSRQKFSKETQVRGIVLCLAIALYGCNSVEIDNTVTDPENNGSHVPLNVKMDIGKGAVVSKSVFGEVGKEAGKLGAVGVLVARTNDASEFEAYTTETVDSYRQYSFNETAGDITWDATSPIYLNNNEGKVYAWAPVEGTDALSATPGIAADKLTAAGVVIGASQTFDAGSRLDCSQTDYLYATEAAASTSQETVSKAAYDANLFMHHALAKISFKVMKAENNPAPDKNDYVKKIELTSKAGRFLTCSAGTMKLTDGTLEGTLAVASLTLSAVAGKAAQAVAYAENYDAVTPQVYGLVAPLVSAEKDLSVKVTLGTNDADTGRDRSYQTKTDGEATFQWEKGKEYIYTISISDVALEIVSVQIVDFAMGGTTDLPVE